MNHPLAHQIAQVEVPPGMLALWGLGQMGLLVKGPDGLIVIDPCLSDYVAELHGDFWRRAFDPPVPPDALAAVDYYLVTHEHEDHFDLQTAAAIRAASPDVHFVAPGWCAPQCARLGLRDSDWSVPPVLQPMALAGTSCLLTALPAAHYLPEKDTARGHRWLGYVLQWNGVTLYHAGDTIFFEGYFDMWQALPRPDAAMLPVNGRDWFRTRKGIIGNLLPDEAARFCHEVPTGLLLIGHNDLYPNNTIPWTHIAASMERHAPRQPWKYLQPGEMCWVQGAD